MRQVPSAWSLPPISRQRSRVAYPYPSYAANPTSATRMATTIARRIAQDIRGLRGNDAMRFSSSRSAGVRTVGLGAPRGLSLGIAGLSIFADPVHETGLRGIGEFYPVPEPNGDRPCATPLPDFNAAHNRERLLTGGSKAKHCCRTYLTRAGPQV